ncbi:MAG: hypothetical protein CMH83_12460 [Nocardioides sp.]|nr:hypothetical protein [Nocardioides sp.]
MALRVSTPVTCPLTLTVHDLEGQAVGRRRLHGHETSMVLPSGRLRLTVEDARDLRDPRRLAPATVEVDVVRGGVVDAEAALTRGGSVRAEVLRAGRPTARAVVLAVHPDGTRVEARTDHTGRALLCGLQPGAWTLDALDYGRRTSSTVHAAHVAAGPAPTEVALPLARETGRLLVRVRSTGARPVHDTEVVVTDAAGVTTTVPVVRGCAEVRGLRPGPALVAVLPSLGHLGAGTLAHVEAGDVAVLDVPLPVGALVTGRVVQRQGPDAASAVRRYAAVVTLLDAAGEVLERTRTRPDGGFELGVGLRTLTGLTVVATSGPQTLRVTQVARADVGVNLGVRHHLGDVVLPWSGHEARWARRSAASAAMRLPSTRV